MKNQEAFIHAMNRINTLVDLVYEKQTSEQDGVYRCDPSSIDTALASHEHKYCSVINLYGSVGTIPYSIHYKQDLDLINKELEILKKQELPEYLHRLIAQKQHTLVSNNWDSFEEQWLDALESHHQWIWNFGPIESYSDKYFGTKKFFSSLLLKSDVQKMKLVHSVIDHISDFRAQLPQQGSLQTVKVQAFVGDLVSWGGEIKKLWVVGWSRPENTVHLEKHGAVIQIFLNNIQKKAKELYIPLAQEVLENAEMKRVIAFQNEEAYLGALLHELCHTIGKFAGYKERMGKCYNEMEEVRTQFTAFLFAKYLEKKKVLREGFTEDFILSSCIEFLQMAYLYEQTGTRKAHSEICHVLFHTLGELIASKDGLIVFPKKKLFPVVKRMSEHLLQLAKDGQMEEVEALIQPQRTVTSLVDILAKKDNIPLYPSMSEE